MDYTSWRHVFILIIGLLCGFNSFSAEYDADPICGEYCLTDGGSHVEIIPLDTYRGALPTELRAIHTLGKQYIILIGDNPSPTLQPSTVMGIVSPLAKPGMYNASIFTKEKENQLSAPKKFLLQLNDDGCHLSMLELKNRLRIDPLRFLPYLFHGISLKGTLKIEDNTPKDIEGFIKIKGVSTYPHAPRAL